MKIIDKTIRILSSDSKKSGDPLRLKNGTLPIYWNSIFLCLFVDHRNKYFLDKIIDFELEKKINSNCRFDFWMKFDLSENEINNIKNVFIEIDDVSHLDSVENDLKKSLECDIDNQILVRSNMTSINIHSHGSYQLLKVKFLKLLCDISENIYENN